jgi:hypothetical protein
LPHIQVWKHPRKKTYTENRFIHLNRIKKDAAKNFTQRRTQELYAELLASFKASTPITEFVDYVKFINKHNIQIAKLAALADDLPIYQYDTSSVVFDFLASICGVTVSYNARTVVGVVILTRGNYFDHRTTTQRILAMLIPMLVGATALNNRHGARDLWFPFSKSFMFNDVVELAAATRLEQENETVINRLADEGDKYLPAALELRDLEVRNLKILVTDAIAPFKPLTLAAIGEKVVVVDKQGKRLTFTTVSQGVLLAYTSKLAIVAHNGKLSSVNPNHVRCI